MLLRIEKTVTVPRRVFFLKIGFGLIIAAVTLRLFSLQVLSHDIYKAIADNQHQAYKTLVPVRGEIFFEGDKDFRAIPAVTNIDKDLVYAVPQEIENSDQTAQRLASLLELGKKEIFEKISDTERKWVALKKELPESVVLKIRELNLPGIYLQGETYRHFPEKELASQVLGFYSFQANQRVGTYGIEEYYEKILAGKSGYLSQDRDVGGRWITGGLRTLQPAEDGANITLTIDRAIQFRAETVLRETVTAHQADSGSLLVISPKTGAILAMANYPTFDPNEFRKTENIQVFRNPIVSEAYEPGSVFKPITMAVGLETEKVTPETRYVDTGSVAIDRFVIRNSDNKVYGEQSMTQVLEQSINTGAMFVQDEVGPESFLEYLKKFGIGEKTEITLPAESPGDIKNLIGGGDVHYATASFGQGITVTPLQLAKAYSTIANQGRAMKPYIVEKIENSNKKSEIFSPQQLGQVISSKTANTLSAMLVSVVENGHGKRAGVPGYYIAGKTGTAQVVNSDGPGYDANKTIGTFAGFGPVEDPKFVMVVKIVNPKTVRFAESTAAPAFGQMAQFLMNYFQIPPTR